MEKSTMLFTPKELLRLIYTEAVNILSLNGIRSQQEIKLFEEIIPLFKKVYNLPEEDINKAADLIHREKAIIETEDPEHPAADVLPSGELREIFDAQEAFQLLWTLRDMASHLDRPEDRAIVQKLAKYFSEYLDLERLIQDISEPDCLSPEKPS